MGLFGKKKEAIVQTVSYRFNKDQIAYHYPIENLSYGSVLFVEPGQEVVVITEGRMSLKGEGRHSLDTDNFPYINTVFNQAAGGRELFRNHLYFINKKVPIMIGWGTPSPIYVDYHYKEVDGSDGEMQIRMQSYGSYTVNINNSLQFLAKLNGQLPRYDAKDIADFLFEKSITVISSEISKLFQQKEIPYNKAQSYISELSEEIQEIFNKKLFFEDYGLTLGNFAIESLTVDDDDYKKLEEFNTKRARLRQENANIAAKAQKEADAMRATGFAEADVMQRQGIYYDKKRSYDVLEKAASNEATLGGFMNAGMGLGLGLGMGNGFGVAAGQVMQNTVNQNPVNAAAPQAMKTVTCPTCGKQNAEGMKFCGDCGTRLPFDKVICPACGYENPKGTKFCGGCGTKLPSDKIICPACGHENEQGTKFCNECGTSLATSNKCSACGHENPIGTKFCGGCGKSL